MVDDTEYSTLKDGDGLRTVKGSPVKMISKLILRYDHFKENTFTTFGDLRESKDFADVTLACEDGQQVEAHKVILAASSPFFQNVLKTNQHTHPLIFMRNVSFENLGAIIDYLYLGEASLLEENLESFLQIAEELALKGLAREDRERGQIQPQIKEELGVENAENVQGFEFEVISPNANESAECSDLMKTEERFKTTRTPQIKPKEKLSDYGRNCRRNTIRTNCIPCGLKFSSARERAQTSRGDEPGLQKST